MAEPDAATPPEPEPEPDDEPLGVIEPAATGRSKCRGCGKSIAKGALRFGERVLNAFADGRTTVWFHLDCAACKRPAELLATLDGLELDVPGREQLDALARAGVEHARLVRIARAERDPSGRARCRQCKETIAKASWRVALDVWDEARFNPIGFVHASCAAAYFGTPDVLERLRRFTPDLSEEELAELDCALG